MATTTAVRAGDEIPQLTVVVSRKLIDDFSVMANDRNPVHMNDEFARGRGFPGAIAHGAIAASFLLRMLTQWLGAWPVNGDDLEITFISPVLVGTAVTAKGVVEAVEGQHLICKVWCENDQGQKAIIGTARIASRTD
jgi:3-hydroxybutyryl-CoA dehydratase